MCCDNTAHLCLTEYNSCFAAPSFPDKMSPVKALTMKDYENVSDALNKKLEWHEHCSGVCILEIMRGADLSLACSVCVWRSK